MFDTPNFWHEYTDFGLTNLGKSELNDKKAN